MELAKSTLTMFSKALKWLTVRRCKKACDARSETLSGAEVSATHYAVSFDLAHNFIAVYECEVVSGFVMVGDMVVKAPYNRNRDAT